MATSRSRSKSAAVSTSRVRKKSKSSEIRWPSCSANPVPPANTQPWNSVAPRPGQGGQGARRWLPGALRCARDTLQLQDRVPECGHLDGLHSDRGDRLQKRTSPHDCREAAYVVQVTMVDDSRNHPAGICFQVSGGQRSIPEQPGRPLQHKIPGEPSGAAAASLCHYSTNENAALAESAGTLPNCLVADRGGAAATLGAIAMATAKGFDDSTVSDELALNYHLMHPGEDSAPGDPNVAYCLDGVYHLHYILRHPWKRRHGAAARRRQRSFSFIHVTSPDMLHWKWQTTKLQPSFTGHGIVQRHRLHHQGGQTGGDLSRPVRSRDAPTSPWPTTTRLSGWSMPYPVLPTGVPEGKRVILAGDPDLFQVGDTYYAYSAGDGLELIKVYRPGPLALRRTAPAAQPARRRASARTPPAPTCSRSATSGCCLCISHQIGCRYYLGDWDAQAEQFVPQIHERMNWPTRRPVAHRTGVPRLLRAGERAHRRMGGA